MGSLCQSYSKVGQGLMVTVRPCSTVTQLAVILPVFTVSPNYSAMVLTSIPCCQVSSSSDTVTHLSSSSPRTRARWPSEVEDGVSSSEDVCSSSQQSADQEEEGSVSSTVPL